MQATSSSCSCNSSTSQAMQNYDILPQKYESLVRKLDLQWILANPKARQFSLVEQEESPLEEVLEKLKVPAPTEHKFVYDTFAVKLYRRFLKEFPFLNHAAYRRSVRIAAFIIAIKFSERCIDPHLFCSRIFNIAPLKYKRMEAAFSKAFPALAGSQAETTTLTTQ